MDIQIPKVLFVCTGNAGRSQMAHAMFRQAAAGRAQVESAGVRPWDDLHPMAVRIMSEKGLGMTGQHPKSASSVADRRFDLVVTIGDPAREEIPSTLVAGATWVHWDIGDPAEADGTDESEAVFRRTCNDIASRLPELLSLLSLSL